MQSSVASLPAALCRLAPHARHVDEAVAAGVAEYVFAAQSRHAAPPVAALYLPATHAVAADVPSAPVNPAFAMHSNAAPAPAIDWRAAPHPKHVDESVAPTVGE